MYGQQYPHHLPANHAAEETMLKPWQLPCDQWICLSFGLQQTKLQLCCRYLLKLSIARLVTTSNHRFTDYAQVI